MQQGEKWDRDECWWHLPEFDTAVLPARYTPYFFNEGITGHLYNWYFSPLLRQQWIFLTSFSFLTCFPIDIDISYHFYKIRLKCEIFSPTFIREKALFHDWVEKNHYLSVITSLVPTKTTPHEYWPQKESHLEKATKIIIRQHSPRKESHLQKCHEKNLTYTKAWRFCRWDSFRGEHRCGIVFVALL